ncbi:MAG: hypothetical protein HKN37_09635 [Rhodothermales bacterium]|nr:hypothetical protein [Rhodothermales bacterium]
MTIQRRRIIQALSLTTARSKHDPPGTLYRARASRGTRHRTGIRSNSLRLRDAPRGRHEARTRAGPRRPGRSESRRGHANGYKPKTLDTRASRATVQVPKTRGIEFYPGALEKGWHLHPQGHRRHARALRPRRLQQPGQSSRAGA